MSAKPLPKEAFRLEGEDLKTYRTAFWDGNESNYFPGGLNVEIYDWGYRDGKQFGPRKGKPWSLSELLAAQAELKKKKAGQ